MAIEGACIINTPAEPDDDDDDDDDEDDEEDDEMSSAATTGLGATNRGLAHRSQAEQHVA